MTQSTDPGEHRIERDTMGEVRVPAAALWKAQTQRAVENFPISGIPINSELIGALGLIKEAAAKTNAALGVLKQEYAAAIEKAAGEVAANQHDAEFPI
ncbi:MAG: fumC, partial [Propionibacteriaceae bacterium]|nr:fumC [Propionibacteriaceae bacterium]